MQPLLFASRQLARLCLLVAGLALLAMMGVTIADVLLRLIFRLSGGALNWSVVGSVELVSYPGGRAYERGNPAVRLWHPGHPER